MVVEKEEDPCTLCLEKSLDVVGTDNKNVGSTFEWFKNNNKISIPVISTAGGTVWPKKVFLKQSRNADLYHPPRSYSEKQTVKVLTFLPQDLGIFFTKSNQWTSGLGHE